MLINFTSHPVEKWSPEQQKAAGKYGEILDMPFPEVPPDVDETAIKEMADDYLDRIKSLRPSAVLCQGEMTLTYEIVRRLIESGISAIAACSERITETELQADGSVRKLSRFVFRRFRNYDTAIYSHEGGK